MSWPDPSHLPLLIPAVLLLTDLKSIAYLLILCIVQAASIFWNMPQVPNHSVLIFALDLALILSFLRLAVPGRLGSDAWLDAVAPAARAMLLIVYFFAFFHKLNSDFFDVQVSCASFVYKVTLAELKMGGFPEPEGAFGAFLIISVLAAELAIPILLLIRPTRYLGIGLGIVFHSLLGVTHYNFSLAVYACYVFFLPKAFFTQILPGWTAQHPAMTKLGRRFIPLTLLSCFYLFFLRNTVSGPGIWQSPLSEMAPQVWMLLSVALLFLYGYFFYLGKADLLSWADETSFSRGWSVLWLFPLLIFFNGLSPYLGWKTGNSYNMFSNLVTEGGRSNHFFIRKGMFQVWGHQDDLALVTGANEPIFYQMVVNRTPVPFVEVQRRVAELAHRGVTGIRLSYLRNGKKYDVEKAEEDPYLTAPLSWVRRKFSLFKENLQLGPPDGIKCSW